MISNKAFEAARKIAGKFGTRDPFEIIDSSKNIRLRLTDAFPANGLKGFATIANRTKYVVINNHLSDEEQRIVAGHELGHIFLHELTLQACPMRDFDIYGATAKLEREANHFGADLLIADEDVLDAISSGDSDFFSVAKELFVPAPFLAFKLFSMVERGYPVRVPVDLSPSFLRSKRDGQR